jgi:hypothetical protein
LELLSVNLDLELSELHEQHRDLRTCTIKRTGEKKARTHDMSSWIWAEPCTTAASTAGSHTDGRSSIRAIV